MEFLLEIVLQGLVEGLLQAAFEILAELGLRSVSEPLRRREGRNKIMAGVGYGLLGCAAGGISLLLFPHALVRSTKFHGISLLTSPLLGGLAMSILGKIRRRQGKRLIDLDSFLYGFIFAFGMALIRFLFTK